MKKLQEILISTRTMAVLLVVFIVAMAYATFLENDYGTPTAKALIYEAKWFELVMLLLILNFIGNMFRYRLFRREKWPVLVFHLSFILIFIGGAITRYISYEGTMHIREGETSNEILTDKSFFKIQIEQQGEVLNYQDIPYIMSPLHHNFNASYEYNGKKVKVRALDYIQRKKDSLVANPKGKDYLHIVSTNDAGRQNIFLQRGEVKSVNGFLVSFNREIDGAVSIKEEAGQLLVKTPVEAQYMTMATQKTGATKANEYQPLVLRSLYTVKDLRLVVPEGVKKGDLLEYEGDKNKDQNIPDLLKLEVEGPKTKQLVDLPVQKGNPNMAKQVTIDGLNVMMGFGAKVYNTSFSIKLDDFVMETYPGSSSPSAYESHIKVIDEGKETAYKIFMNNVMNYKGYRFFQASFDPDQHGTILSVNHDFWGTIITYIGYGLLFLGLFVSLFWKGTRFWTVNKMLKDVSVKKGLSVALLLLSVFGLNAQTPAKTQKELSANDLIQHINIDPAHADKFGAMLIQTYDGRIAPVNSQALDILRKLTKRESFKDLSANQWFLAATIDPMFWAQVDIIKVGTKGGDKLKAKTRANDEGFTSLVKLFPADKNGNLSFVLEEDYNIAFRKKPAEQSNYDKEVITVNDRVQVMNGLMSWQYFRVIPVQNDPNHTWTSVMDNKFEMDKNAQQILGPYLASVLMATQDNNWKKADAELIKVQQYQNTWGKNVIPSKSKIDLEILQNKINLNFKLLIFYTIIGFLLLFLAFIELFKPSRVLNTVIKVIIGIGIVGYLLHFLGLGMRWYISGHAPWSNGYEAIVFISWVGISAGLLLYRNANALIPAAGFLVAVIMMGFAHGGSQLDPQITPLVPVLKSYWLIIHVAIITSSYGFFALSMLIAVITLIFYIISGKNIFNRHNDTTIKELTLVSEMSLTIGLFTLTVGNFLGGIWANESWGRYWSWDPKETWAFISIIVYAFVLHMRLVPGLRGRLAFHIATMFAFCSMVMTYFGVNYYLSGLHSYAAGDPIPIPAWVYIGLATMLTLSVLGHFRYKYLSKKN